MKNTNWRTNAARRINNMSWQAAHRWLDSRSGRGQYHGQGIGDKAIKELTGGYSSQSIDFEVCRMVHNRARGFTAMGRTTRS